MGGVPRAATQLTSPRAWAPMGDRGGWVAVWATSCPGWRGWARHAGAGRACRVARGENALVSARVFFFFCSLDLV